MLLLRGNGPRRRELRGPRGDGHGRVDGEAPKVSLQRVREGPAAAAAAADYTTSTAGRYSQEAGCQQGQGQGRLAHAVARQQHVAAGVVVSVVCGRAGAVAEQAALGAGQLGQGGALRPLGVGR